MKHHLPALMLLALSMPAAAETTAIIQKGLEGRNQIMILNAMRDGREVMLVASCPTDEPERITGLIDFGAGPRWNLTGETVRLDLDGFSVERKMSTINQYLVLPGTEGNDTFRAILEADAVSVEGPDDIKAEFVLSAVQTHIEAFRPLCAK